MTRDNSGDELDPYELDDDVTAWLRDQYDEAWREFIEAELRCGEAVTVKPKGGNHGKRQEQFTKYRTGSAKS